MWRGPAFGEFTGVEFAVLERHRLDEVRAIAVSTVDALIESGRHELVVAELEEAVTVNPLRERLWAQLMLALYRSGRQADALRAYGRARRRAGRRGRRRTRRALRELEQRILQQDPGLELHATASGDGRDRPVGPDVHDEREARPQLLGRSGGRARCAAPPRPDPSAGLDHRSRRRRQDPTRRRARPTRDEAWEHGAWMLELDTTSGPDGVARALLTAFGGHPDVTNASVDVSAAVDTAAATIGEAAALLVLDNCEHVLTDARTVASALLARCPQLRILATSRVVLDVAGETVRQANHCRSMTPSPCSARGVDAQHDFVVGGDDGSIRSICEHVDCLPLGIELAAARLRAFTPGQLDAQLAERLSSIAATSAARDARHRTLPATVGWSYGLLFEPEQSLLRALSVFRGSFALDAVEAVATDDEVTAPDVADTLARLVDKSLVVAERGAASPATGSCAPSATSPKPPPMPLTRPSGCADATPRGWPSSRLAAATGCAARASRSGRPNAGRRTEHRGRAGLRPRRRCRRHRAPDVRRPRVVRLTTTSLPSTLDHVLALLRLDGDATARAPASPGPP